MGPSNSGTNTHTVCPWPLFFFSFLTLIANLRSIIDNNNENKKVRSCPPSQITGPFKPSVSPAVRTTRPFDSPFSLRLLSFLTRTFTLHLFVLLCFFSFAFYPSSSFLSSFLNPPSSLSVRESSFYFPPATLSRAKLYNHLDYPPSRLALLCQRCPFQPVFETLPLQRNKKTAHSSLHAPCPFLCATEIGANDRESVLFCHPRF